LPGAPPSAAVGSPVGIDPEDTEPIKESTRRHVMAALGRAGYNTRTVDGRAAGLTVINAIIHRAAPDRTVDSTTKMFEAEARAIIAELDSQHPPQRDDADEVPPPERPPDANDENDTHDR
jgi:hypothetical protein